MSDKIRMWTDPTGCSSTGIALKDDKIFMHTNLGWVGPLTYELDEGETILTVINRLAHGYELEEIEVEDED